MSGSLRLQSLVKITPGMFGELWYSLCSSYHGYQKELLVSSHYLKNRPIGPTSGDSSPCVKTPRLCILSLQLSLGMLPKARCHHNGTFSPYAPATLQRQVSPASLKLGVTVMSVPLETRESQASCTANRRDNIPMVSAEWSPQSLFLH